MNFKEKSKQMHRRILAALGKSHRGGLCKVDVPIEENGVTTQWRTVTDTRDLKYLIVDRNRECLQQADQNPFGTGEGYEMLHGEYCFINMNKILEGQFTYKLKD